MYLRMVEATVKMDVEAMLGGVYAEKILSSLEKTPGCIFAGLLHSHDHSKKYISLTLWKSQHDAEAYEQSGAYQKNLESVKDYLEKGSEWKIHLSEDNTVEYSPVPVEPNIKIYPVFGNENHLPDEVPANSNYLRILSLKINNGYKDEFTHIYNSEILPELKKIEGCRYVFLLDNSDHDGEMISLSIWDDADAVEYYEKEGAYKGFLKKIEHTLGGLYQWKMALENHSRTKSAITSHDIGIRKFTLITGRKFN